MRKIYEHIDFARVGHFQSILEAADIGTHIKNLGAATASGEIPFVQCYPELWVSDDRDYERALKILQPYYDQESAELAPWKCPGCGELVEGEFGQCWNCQTMQPAPGGGADCSPDHQGAKLD